MTVVLCVDDNNGMMFNHRRQSQDRALRERLLTQLNPKRLWMNAYSAEQFADHADCIRVDEAFLQKAAPEDFCFVENIDITPYVKDISKIILYKWNRSYPADLKFTCPMTDWTLVSQTDFAGSSHDKITEAVFTR